MQHAFYCTGGDLLSVMGFTVICCEFSLCVHCCCLIAIVDLAATCSK